MRLAVTLECTDCQSRNYNTSRKREQTGGRMELRKHCRKCRKHTVHRESR